MIVSAEEISVLDSALWWWEFREYASEAIVILGCVGEFIAEFTNIGERCKWLSKTSLLVLILGLCASLASLVMTTITSGKIIASINEKTISLEVANTKLGIDLVNARIALTNKQEELERKQHQDALDLEVERQKTALLAKENLVFQERLAWRRITPAQHDRFVAMLTPFKGSTLLGMVNGPGKELSTFNDDVVKVFHDAGWIASVLS